MAEFSPLPARLIFFSLDETAASTIENRGLLGDKDGHLKRSF
jgi:hypothetical protein